MLVAAAFSSFFLDQTLGRITKITVLFTRRYACAYLTAACLACTKVVLFCHSTTPPRYSTKSHPSEQLMFCFTPLTLVRAATDIRITLTRRFGSGYSVPRRSEIARDRPSYLIQGCHVLPPSSSATDDLSPTAQMFETMALVSDVFLSPHLT